jgi:hypothetical protein
MRGRGRSWLLGAEEGVFQFFEDGDGLLALNGRGVVEEFRGVVEEFLQGLAAFEVVEQGWTGTRVWAKTGVPPRMAWSREMMSCSIAVSFGAVRWPIIPLRRGRGG